MQQMKVKVQPSQVEVNINFLNFQVMS